MANDQRSAARPVALLKASAAFTLTEVVVAILLTGIIVTGTFSAILVTRKTPEISTNRVLAGMAERQLLDSLQNYQTTSIGTIANNCITNPGDDWCRGPNSSWALPADGACGANCQCPTSPARCSQGGYALEAGCTHDASSILPQFFTGAPAFATLCYTVVNLNSAGLDPSTDSSFRPQVTVNVQWNESQE